MKNILDKIAELPSGEKLERVSVDAITTTFPKMAPTGLTTDDLHTIRLHLKRMEEMLAQAIYIEFDDDALYCHKEGVKVFSKRDAFFSPTIHPDALTAFESLKEQK